LPAITAVARSVKAYTKAAPNSGSNCSSSTSGRSACSFQKVPQAADHRITTKVAITAIIR
jgi:hypothetical protein